MIFILIGVAGFLIGWLFCAKVLHHHDVNVMRKEVGLPTKKLNIWKVGKGNDSSTKEPAG